MNQRTIKFRAWDFEHNRMLPVSDVGFYHAETGKNGLSGIIATRPDGRDQFHPGEQVVLEQFTGLLDKNGKEIYEGDIYMSAQGYKYQVFFKNGAFCGGTIAFIGEPLGWQPGDALVVEDDFTASIEVIGNIHANPELLEKVATPSSEA